MASPLESRSRRPWQRGTLRQRRTCRLSLGRFSIPLRRILNRGASYPSRSCSHLQTRQFIAHTLSLMFYVPHSSLIKGFLILKACLSCCCASNRASNVGVDSSLADISGVFPPLDNGRHLIRYLYISMHAQPECLLLPSSQATIFNESTSARMSERKEKTC
jgi:hypothetical protein